MPRQQENWSNVSLYPSPGFVSKNHLAKDGPGCVAPVIFPALAPTLDKSLKEDRTLCPVRALCYYLDKTKDFRAGKELVFVSFKKSLSKDIVPATISSWIKQMLSIVRWTGSNLTPSSGTWCPCLRSFQSLPRRCPIRSDPFSLSLEVSQYIHPILPEGCSLGGFRLIPFGPCCCCPKNQRINYFRLPLSVYIYVYILFKKNVPAVCFDSKRQMRDCYNFPYSTSLGILGSVLFSPFPYSFRFHIILKRKGGGEHSGGCWDICPGAYNL